MKIYVIGQQCRHKARAEFEDNPDIYTDEHDENGDYIVSGDWNLFAETEQEAANLARAWASIIPVGPNAQWIQSTGRAVLALLGKSL